MAAPVSSSDGQLGSPLSASVFSRDVVGPFADRFRWPHPISHDWPTVLHLHTPIDLAPWDASSHLHHLEPQYQDINQSLATGISESDGSPLTYYITTQEDTMEFSGRDLADIQRVAGLLKLTVDELLQQSRTRSQKDTTPVASPIQPSRIHGARQRQGSFPDEPFPDIQHQEFLDLDSDAFNLGGPQSNSSGNEISLPGLQQQGTEVILLNPQNTWYDCDAALWNQDESFPELPETFSFDDASFLDLEEGRSGFAASGMEVDSGSTSEHTAREEDQEVVMDDVSSDWLVLPSPSEPSEFQAAVSPSASSTDKRYHRIAPKFSKASAHSTSEASSYRVKKKRSRYEGSKRIDTHLTRQVHACVRCRMQRNRVSD